jgi:hypothetical protein
LRPQLARDEGAGGALPVRAADVDAGKVALRMTEHVE